MEEGEAASSITPHEVGGDREGGRDGGEEGEGEKNGEILNQPQLKATRRRRRRRSEATHVEGKNEGGDEVQFSPSMPSDHQGLDKASVIATGELSSSLSPRQEAPSSHLHGGDADAAVGNASNGGVGASLDLDALNSSKPSSSNLINASSGNPDKFARDTLLSLSLKRPTERETRRNGKPQDHSPDPLTHRNTHSDEDSGFSSFSDTPREEQGKTSSTVGKKSSRRKKLISSFQSLSPLRYMKGSGVEHFSRETKYGGGEVSDHSSKSSDDDDFIMKSPSRTRKRFNPGTTLLIKRGAVMAKRGMQGAMREVRSTGNAFREWKQRRYRPSESHENDDSDGSNSDTEGEKTQDLRVERSSWMAWMTWSCPSFSPRTSDFPRVRLALQHMLFWCATKCIPASLRAPAEASADSGATWMKRRKSLAQHLDGVERDDIILFHIGKVDRMEGDSRMTHPMVILHIVDERTGKYLKTHKRDPQVKEGPLRSSAASRSMKTSVWHSREVPTEPEMEHMYHNVAPAGSRLAVMKGRASEATWDEDLLIDASYHSFLAPHVILLVEIVDFSTKPSELHRVAWGYLRAANFKNGVERRVQLYQYVPLSAYEKWEARQAGIDLPPPPLHSLVPDVYVQYLRKRRCYLPSAITISLCHRPPLEPVSVLRRPQAFNEVENHVLTVEDLLERRNGNGDEVAIGEGKQDFEQNYASAAQQKLLRMRGPTDRCVLPTQLLCRVQIGSLGGTCGKFSNDGTVLAVAASDDPLLDKSCIYLLDTDTGQIQDSLSGHRGIVYDLNWSDDDALLLSASSDGTARVWRMRKSAAHSKEKELHAPVSDFQKMQPKSVLVLQHSPPVYVYCGIFAPVLASTAFSSHGAGTSVGGNNTTSLQGDEGSKQAGRIHANFPILTGGFDCKIHLWDSESGKSLGALEGGRGGHASHINAMTKDRRSGRVYTGDAKGVVLIWRRSGSGFQTSDYSVLRRLAPSDMIGRPIIGLDIAPHRRRPQLLIASQGNIVRLYDLTNYQQALPGFSGASTGRTVIRAHFSPDGRYVASGAEDGRLRIWETRTGRRVRGRASTAALNVPLRDVCWHPKQHTVALIGYGPDVPVVIYWGKREAGIESLQADATGNEKAAESSSTSRGSVARASLGRRGTLEEDAIADALELQEQKEDAQQREANRERLRQIRLKRLQQRARALGSLDHNLAATAPAAVPSLSRALDSAMKLVREDRVASLGGGSSSHFRQTNQSSSELLEDGRQLEAGSGMITAAVGEVKD